MLNKITPIKSSDEAQFHGLTDEQIELIAEKAAEKAIEKLTSRVYQEVGKSVVTKFVYVVGALSVGLYVWLKHKGFIL